MNATVASRLDGIDDGEQKEGKNTLGLACPTSFRELGQRSFIYGHGAIYSVLHTSAGRIL